MYCLIVIVAVAGLTPASGQQKSGTAKPSAKTNRFAVPTDASPEELGKFLDFLRVAQPTKDEAKDRIRAVYECSAALLESDADEKYLVMAAEARLNVLPVMPRIDPDYSGQTQAQFVRKLAAHKNPKLAVIARHFGIMGQVRGFLKMQPPARTALIEEAFALAKEYGVDARTFTLLRTNIGMELENAGNYADAGKIYDRLAPMMASSSDPRLKNYGAKLKAAADRCLNLLGKPIELSGTLHDGKPFDWNAYKGKVVLVDFWATWCKPCVKELPYFEALHENFKGEKIKVILVSLDFKKDVETKLIPFVEEHKLKSDVVALTDHKYNEWIDKVDPEWGGAIPVTVV